jgi:hypothetical protein
MTGSGGVKFLLSSLSSAQIHLLHNLRKPIILYGIYVLEK